MSEDQSAEKLAVPAGPGSSEGEASFGDDPRIRFVEETGKYVYTGDDNVSYEWDNEKHAWFPMWDQDLVDSQQAAYGPTVLEEAAPKRTKRKHVYTSDETQPKKPKAEAKKKPNTSVYVTGLPPDTTQEEVKEVFEKFGIIMEDLKTGKPKIKLYLNDAGEPQGDALVSYFKEESVELACNLLDESDFRVGKPSTIRVQKAVFQEKERPPVTEKAKTTAADKKVFQKKMSKLEKRLDWFEEEPSKKADKFAKLVVLKHMFTLKELEEDPALMLDLKEDVRDECEKLGEVTNVILYDLEDSGVMTIRFKEAESAELCIRKMNGRFFAGRRIEAALFDGKTKYAQSKSDTSTEEEEKQRLEAYEKWLEAQH
ncbi:hypothetical protein HDU89_007073 [Geranomyces variabilis]|nr:hypothetical protein HDU89_007073 [Geranomyces variabilis]